MNLKKVKNYLPLILAVCLGFLFSVSYIVHSVSVLETDNELSSATTTPVTLLYDWATTTAHTYAVTTSTLTFATHGVDYVDLSIQFQGSSTDATLNWKYEFSDNFMDWYGEDLAQTSAANAITHSSTTLAHSWNPETTAVVRKNISINPIASRYMRIAFTTSNATSSVYARVALKSELNR